LMPTARLELNAALAFQHGIDLQLVGLTDCLKDCQNK
jgi:hypothetical protein